MSYSHAVLWMDHQEGHLVRFNLESHESEHIRAYEGHEQLHRHAGTLGDGKAKAHPDYFPKLARAVDSADAVLVVGAGVAKREFLHYLEATSPQIRAKVMGTENSERITEPQLLALAKDWFKPNDRMRGLARDAWMKFTDYYKTLGVESSASADDIKKAFRKLVRKHHPDLNKAPDAERRMQEINEANDVLSDAEKRLAYDTLARRQAAGQEFSPPPGWADGFEFTGRAANGSGSEHEMHDSDFFNALFGASARGRAGPFRSSGGGESYNESVRGTDHHSKMTIPLEDSFTGSVRELTLRSPEVDASGQVSLRERTLQVNIPKGVYAGQQIRLAKQGAPGMGTGALGDLYLEIDFLPHPVYRPDGRDLYVTLPLAPWELVLGATIMVPTPGGVVEMNIPADSHAGKKMRLKGRGIPSKEPGDEYLLLEVALPPATTDKARALYKQMSEELPFNPRSHLGV